jgi:uncharacterized membrane protein YesL
MPSIKPLKKTCMPPEDQDLAISNHPNSLKDWWEEMGDHAIPLFNVNLAFFVISLPVVTILPALGGLYDAILKIKKDGGANWGTVWGGFKKHGWLSMKWGLTVLLGYFFLGANLCVFQGIEPAWGTFAIIAMIVITILWTTINQYSLTLLLVSSDHNILQAIATGFLIMIRQPLASLGVLLVSLSIGLVSILLPPLLIFFSIAAIAFIQTGAALKSLSVLREKDAGRTADEMRQPGR